MRDFYQVTVAAVIRETGDASSFVLDVPPPLAATFAYRPGQFVTVRVPSDRTGSVARCYSLCSSPHAGDPPAITVKRTAGGYASNWLAGQRHGRAPSLTCCPRPGPSARESLDGDFLLFAAGSGITPVISILKSVLAAGRGRVALVYANRDERSVIFSDELRRLAASAAGRLAVLHWLDSLQGTPAAAAIAALARPYAAWEPYVCGPDPYLTVVRAALGQLGVPAKRVRAERFLSLAENPFEETRADGGGLAATLSVELDGATRGCRGSRAPGCSTCSSVPGLPRPTRAARESAARAPASSLAGEVEMAHNEVLEAADLADGYILACQAVPLTPEVRVTY